MKQLPKIISALLFALLLCIPSVLAVFYYSHPMEDVSYDLSLLPEDGQEWEGPKGWTIFKSDKGNNTELTPDGWGGYSGLDYAGQTFYFSRTLTEELDSPTLQIGAVNRTVSVFLDDTLIYSDCPELDNRIGYLELPMLEYDRMDRLTISLPPDYQGRTLTIAQSSPVYSEKQSSDQTVYPAEVILYCGYSYESGIISDAAKTMIPAVLLFALELFLLGAFIWNASLNIIIPSLPVLSVATLFHMCSVLAQANFFFKYFGTLSLDPVWLFLHLSIGALLAFLTIYAKRLRPLFLLVTVLQIASTIAHYLVQEEALIPYGDTYLFFVNLPQITGFIALLAVTVCAFILWKMGNEFFRHMAKAELVIMFGYVIVLFVSIMFDPDYIKSVFSRIAGEALILLPNFTLKLLWYLNLISSLFAILLEVTSSETRRRTETAVLATKSELAIESYENLLHQSEEIRMIRHDTVKHYRMLRQMSEESPERMNTYLDELIGDIQNIQPVVSSGNQIIDILLNGKLGTAYTKGISVEIVRSDAPESLPLTDTEICCLFMNILDNAVNAAAETTAGNPYIKLDFHQKDQHFVFSCENSMSENPRNKKKEPSKDHGYGLKIIHKIMERWDSNMISVEQAGNIYKMTVVIPLA